MYNRCAATLRCCQNCTPLCGEEFKQVVNLKKSGLLIYVHNSDLLLWKNFDQRKESIILCNSTNKELKRFEYVSEICQYRTKCFKCRALIQRIRNLMDNITVIRKNETLGICDHCKRSPLRNKCKRCEYYMQIFLSNENKRYLEREKKFHEWLYNLRQVLLSLIQGTFVCKHNIYLDSESKMQLDYLLKNINCPKIQRRLNCEQLFDFSDNLKLENSFHSSNLIKKTGSEIITNTELVDDISESELTNCICKYLLQKTLLEKSKLGENSSPSLLLETKVAVKEMVNDISVTPNKPRKLKQNVKEITKAEVCVKEKTVPQNKVSPKTGKNNQIQFPESENELILKMIKIRNELKHKMKQQLQSKSVQVYPKTELPSIDSLKKENEISATIINKSESGSIVECNSNRSSYVTEMVKGTKIVPYHEPKPEHVIEKGPLLFQIQHDFNLPMINTNISLTPNDLSENCIKNTKTNDTKNKLAIMNNPGIIRYQLSNREFIDNGWTKLPSIKIMRRTNIYKMVPSYSKFDWFKNHMNEKMLCYGSSEKLAEVFEDGCGKWFYKNGNTALDYYSTAEMNLGKRCIIYSSSEVNVQNKKSLNVIASFDYFGNGVVYDNNGKVRLKYNQSEGFVIDKNIGPPSHWMWHTLNEPPVLFSVFCDTFVKKKSNSNLKNEEVIDEISEIEFEKNRLKKEADLQKAYKPIEIRMKVVKINDYFSLRIVDQSKIYIHFRCEHVCLKLNVGMFLKNKEIISSDIAVVSARNIDPFDFPKDA